MERFVRSIIRTIEPLKAELSDTWAIITCQAKKIAALEATVNTLADNQLTQLRLIADLRESIKKNPQPLQKDRADILRALITANDGKILAKDARQKMHLSRSSFSKLLHTMKDYVEIKPYHFKKN